MELTEAKRMARELMKEHGIGHWKLSWMDERHTAGTCQTEQWSRHPKASYGHIKLSRTFFEYFDVLEARDTILHEIAHALTDPKLPGHGRIWKAKARSIGAKGNQYVDARENAKPQYSLIGTCPQGHTVRLRSVGPISCKKCNDRLGGAHMFEITAAPEADSKWTAIQNFFLGV